MLTMVLGCANKQVEQLAVETMDNSRVSMAIAESQGARDVAVNEMNSAEEMLINAESSLLAGDVKRAYRLALRAYLHARIATEKSIAIQEEDQVKEAQAELGLGQKMTAEVLKNLETLRSELRTKKK